MNGRPLRVWLVDDDASIRWVLERALKGGGMLPRVFEAAEPALEALRSDAPDVLLTDIRMPGQSGLELGPLMPRVASSMASSAARALKPICIGSTGEPSTCACIVPESWL